MTTSLLTRGPWEKLHNPIFLGLVFEMYTSQVTRQHIPALNFPREFFKIKDILSVFNEILSRLVYDNDNIRIYLTAFVCEISQP